MIKTFRNRGLKLFWEEGNARKLPVQNTQRVKLILDALDAATKPADMDLPGMVFHPLKQYSPLRYSVRVSGNFRITWAWTQGAVDVDLEDYH
jgi:proteic killer suppression protein